MKRIVGLIPLVLLLGTTPSVALVLRCDDVTLYDRDALPSAECRYNRPAAGGGSGAAAGSMGAAAGSPGSANAGSSAAGGAVTGGGTAPRGDAEAPTSTDSAESAADVAADVAAEVADSGAGIAASGLVESLVAGDVAKAPQAPEPGALAALVASAPGSTDAAGTMPPAAEVVQPRSAVPEPETLTLLSLGALTLVTLRRRKRLSRETGHC